MKSILLAKILVLLLVTFAGQLNAEISKITYYHNDTLGSPRVATGAEGELLWSENYAPFGKKLENQIAETSNHIGYTGKPHERITGFTYLNARYYDPVIGRFMAVDPIQFIDKGTQYFQRYTYADNNPYKYTDPSGENYVVALAVIGVVALVAALNEAFDGEAQEVAKNIHDHFDEKQPKTAEGLMAEGTDSIKEHNDLRKDLLGETMEDGKAIGGLPGNSMTGGLPESISDLALEGIGYLATTGPDDSKKKKEEPTPPEPKPEKNPDSGDNKEKTEKAEDQ